MYSEKEKQQLMDDLVEMETFQADVGDEGIILQKDFQAGTVFLCIQTVLQKIR